MAPGGSESVRNSGVRNPDFTIPMRFVAERVMRERGDIVRQVRNQPAIFLEPAGWTKRRVVDR